MPQRRRLAMVMEGLGNSMADLGKLQLTRNMQNQQADKTQANERMNQLLNDFDTSARAISTPDHVSKVGADVAHTEMQNLRRRLPPGVDKLVGPDPDFTALDSSVGEREGGLMKDLGSITNPDDVSLTPLGVKARATAARVPTDVSFPLLGSSAQSDATQEDPEFSKLLAAVQGQKEGLLAKEPTDASTDVKTGVQQFSTARQRNAPGFKGVQTALTPDEEVAKTVKTTRQNAQANADVDNNLTNQQGKARGAGLVAGAQKRADLAAEMAQMGITGQQQTGALQLADDFEKASGDYFKVRSAMRQVQGLEKLHTGQADTGIIFGYMKALDPNSSVREGEAATVANAGSITARVREAYNKAINGQKLDDSVRSEVLSAMRSLYTTAKQDHEDRVKLFTTRARQLRVPSDLVVREPDDTGAGGVAPEPLSPLARARAAGGQQ